MPLVEYRCRSCSARFEFLLRRPRDRAVCPSCAGARLTRLFSPFGISAGSAAGSGACASGEVPPGGCGAPACGGGTCASGGP